MDEDLIINAMKIHPSLKINKNIKKIILREYAENIGINRELAFRPKLAGQYGSNINNEIKKLAKKNNFIFVRDYLDSLNCQDA